MPKTRAQKEETVVKLSEKLGRAKAVVFTDYKGLNMKQLSDLRDKLREQNAELTVTKNTLLKMALAQARGDGEEGLPTHDRSDRLASEDVRRETEPAGPRAALEGPTATLFAYDDEISPIKILVKALKDASIGKVKSGFLGEMALDEAKIIQLSSLPTKDELRGKTVGVLVAPLQGILSVLNGNLRNLVYALNQIKISKGGDAQASS